MPSVSDIHPFSEHLNRHGLDLVRDKTTVLQLNVGRYCDLTCRHCHLEAGPHRRNQVMSRQTMDEVLAFARRGNFEMIDVTGGVPELVPGLTEFPGQPAELFHLAAGTDLSIFRHQPGPGID